MADFTSLDGYNVRDDNALRKDNPTGTGALSLNRKSGTTVGDGSCATGYNGEASGNWSHVEGRNCKATGINSHAQGGGTEASGLASHAEGNSSVASGENSHAEGNNTKAQGNGSHSEGLNTIASGIYSHAEGASTTASGKYSHAEGEGANATHLAQHVFGQYNINDPSANASTQRGDYAEIVGNGTSFTNKSNARTLDWSGNEVIAGTLTQNSDGRLKNILPDNVPDLSEVMAHVFKWNDDFHDDNKHVGYIAQDIEAIAPYLVREDNGIKSLDYIAVLVAKIAYLEKRVADLENR